VPIGESGDIAITGGCMLGYWGKPEKSAQAVRDDWLYTGDVGRMDADGYVYVRGRSDERLTVAGEAWYPRDVEEALLEHPAVSAAALIGLPHDKLGEQPVAFLILKDSSRTDAEFIAFAEQRVGRDLAALVIRRVQSLPMTPTGKISKAELRKSLS
jgi:long-chain acyl-CoA synthetase